MKIIKRIFMYLICIIFVSCSFFSNLISDATTTYHGVRYTWLFYIPSNDGIIYEIENDLNLIPMAKIIKEQNDNQDFSKEGYDCFWVSHSQARDNPKNFVSKIKIKIIYKDGSEEELETNISVSRLEYTNDSKPIEKVIPSKKYNDGIKCVFDYWFS